MPLIWAPISALRSRFFVPLPLHKKSSTQVGLQGILNNKDFFFIIEILFPKYSTGQRYNN